MFPTAAQIDAISPSPVLRQIHWPNGITVWSSAAFNKYGWFYTTAGAHFAGYMNDTYLVRIADPVGVTRMHMPAPIEAVARRDTGRLVAKNEWAPLEYNNVTSSTEWGPIGCHQYSGIIWDADSERMVFAGDAQSHIANPTAIGSLAQFEFNIFVFNPYASTPRQAWIRIAVPNSGMYNHGTGMMKNADGTISFRRLGDNSTYTLNLLSNKVTIGSPHKSPMPDPYQAWRHVARDSVSGRTFELHQQTIGPYHYDGLALYETTSGSYVKVANLPSSGFGSDDNDDQSKIEIINKKAYIIRQAEAVSPDSMVKLTVYQVDLNTGAVLTFNNEQRHSIPEMEYASGNINGIHGRFGFVPEVGCFVVFLSARSNIWVFRPPSTWVM